MGEEAIPVEISAAEFSRWLTPLQTFDLLSPQWTYEVICNTLRRLLIHDQLTARARTIVIERRGEAKRSAHNSVVFAHLWRDNPPQSPSHFWQNGLIDFREGVGSVVREYACFDVRFDPEVIHSLIKAPATLPNTAAQARSDKAKGGAPRKGWWDDLWIEMIRRIKANELHPTSGGDLQRIMEDWLGEQGIYPGDDTLKKTANKLFKYLRE